MKNILILFLLLFPLLLKAQNQKKYHGDTIHIKKICEDAQCIGLDDLRFSTDSIRYRIWNSGKMIDVRINKDTTASKILYYYATKKETRSILYDKKALDSENTQVIIDLLSELKDIDYFNLNVDTTRERDGGIYQGIEISDKNNYVFLTYRVLSIYKLVNKITDTLEMEKESNLFFQHLPNGAFYSRGGGMRIHKMSRFDYIMSLFRKE